MSNPHFRIEAYFEQYNLKVSNFLVIKIKYTSFIYSSSLLISESRVILHVKRLEMKNSTDIRLD